MIPRLVARVSAGTIRVELHRNGTVRWGAEADWSAPEDLAETLSHLAGECALPRLFRSIRVELDAELVQLRRLEGLPKVRGGALRELVGIAPQRYFRRNGVPLVVDVRWESGRSRAVAVAAAIPLPLASAIVRGAEDAGFVVEGIHPSVADEGRRLQFLPIAERTRREAKALVWTRLFGVAACVTWTLLGATLVGRDLIQRRRVEARLAELRGPLDALLATKTAGDSAAAMVARLDADQATEGAAVTTLFHIAAAIPDSAFLTQIRIDSAGAGLVAGAARRPAAVLASLERDGGLRTPRFAGRTTPDLIAGRPVERFAIDFGGRGETQ